MSNALHSLGFSKDSNPREAIQQTIFPDSRIFQALITEMLGKPYQGQKPLYEKTASALILQKAVLLWIGLSISTFGVGLIPIGWIITLHVLRWLRLSCQHAAAHRLLFHRQQRLNFLTGEIISILTLSGDFRTYGVPHTHLHHRLKSPLDHPALMKPGDETFVYLVEEADFQLGSSVDDLWMHLWTTLFSPLFHTKRFMTRLQSTFCSPYMDHNFWAICFWLAIGILVSVNGVGLPFLVSIGVPISIGFEASSLLRQCVEHRFPVPPTEERSNEVLSQMTSAIFLAEFPPQFFAATSWTERGLTWGRWWVRLFGYHFMCRFLVLTGDSPCHDWHHRHPGGNWLNAVFERQSDLEAGSPGWGRYSENWGFLEAIDVTFHSMSLQPKTNPVNPR